ncbi:MAG: Asparagine synthetase 3 [Planctomycetota bacterium]
MCGLTGSATSLGRSLGRSERSLADERDLLAHRGPDAGGLFMRPHVAIAHRRLALLDREGGTQPFTVVTADGRRAVVAWNGELYDHAALRPALEREGARFRTRSDTETLAWLIALRGVEALAGVRGMYAIAAYLDGGDGGESGDRADARLVLARDPFGIVPLLHARVAVDGGFEIRFASEAAPILASPGFRIEPDWPTVAAYLEMPRRSFGARTLYRGLFAVEPGATVSFDLRDPTLAPIHGRIPAPVPEPAETDLHRAAWRVREEVIASVASHLVADDRVCTLLSGGIDSTIVASIARTRSERLVTFAAGAESDATRPGSDLFTARRIAGLLGSEHHEILVGEDDFGERWDALLAGGHTPLATPNEIAIAMLGDAIRPHAKAALSGEGADELFGGYGPPLEATIAWTESAVPHGTRDAAAFYRAAFGWSPRAVTAELFAGGVADAAFGADDPLGALLESAYADAGDPTSIDAHLAVLRRVNLVNLLERLNLSLMRGSVEGRVPFADPKVLASALAAGSAHLFAPSPNHGALATATRTLVTKRVLRHAFADVLSPEVLERPKASFPLPFERWIAAQSQWIDGPVAREVFSPAARELVRTQAAQHWRLAWPMLNLARWLDLTFGSARRAA